MSRLVLTAVLGVVLASPASAIAAQQIGSNQEGPRVEIDCSTGEACILTQDTIGGDDSVNVVPSAGKLTGFRVQGADGSFRFVVLRVVDGALTIANQTRDIVGQGAASDVTYTFDPYIPVQDGDFIGIQLSSEAAVGARDATGDGDTNLFEFSADGSFTDAPDSDYELLLSATFEPGPTDDGGSSVGPVSATPDTVAALRRGERPKAKISGRAVTVTRKRVAAVEIANPNGYALTGTLALSAGGRALGHAEVALPAGASRRIRVRLSRRAMRRLRRRGRLRATATATLRGPVGEAGVSRQKLTLRARRLRRAG